MTSPENIEIARRVFTAWNDADMDAFRDLYDPDVIVRAPVGWPEPGPFVGRDAAMRQFEQIRATYDSDAVEPISDFIGAGDRVAVRFRWHGVGHGPDPNLELTVLYTVRNGMVHYLEYLWNHDEALEALGLREQGTASANLDLVREICEARERGEYGSADWAHPDIEYVLADGPTPGTWTGVAEMAAGIRDFLSAWEGFRALVDDYRELDDGRILVLLSFSGRGKTSGLELSDTTPKGANIFHLRDGKVTRIVHYFDRASALADLAP